MAAPVPAPGPTQEGNTCTFAYDARGLMTQATEPSTGSGHVGNSTTHVYDEYGRITQVKKSPGAVFDPGSGQSSGGQETIDIAPMDTSAPFINELG